MKYKYFAIDFDGTITDRYTGKINPDAIRVINRIREHGGEVAIWTCRTDQDAEEAKQLLKESNLMYDSFNDTLPSVKKQWGGNGRKIWAEVYIDDLSIHCRNGVDWGEIEKWIWGD